ncbi:hypothetical protein [Nitratireductor soli]|uniref:hypothetical protein n=1 Tax=Nitratireductor soli TaxID=1670619 RepID=UPI00065E7BAE|nr:hypothetical protein [Nitratireductor soli]
MHHSADNGIKNRLIDPRSMTTEVLRLLGSGVSKDRVAVELSRLFYVDIDLLNAVLRALPKQAAQPAGGSEDVHRPPAGEKDRAAA